MLRMAFWFALSLCAVMQFADFGPFLRHNFDFNGDHPVNAFFAKVEVGYGTQHKSTRPSDAPDPAAHFDRCGPGRDGLKIARRQRPGLFPTDGDFDILFRTVWGEARSQGDDEVAAVVHVILNRWIVGCMGRRLREVLLDARQFSCWNVKDLNHRVVTLPVGALEKNARFRRLRALAFDIVDRRLQGSEDPTKGALCYFHPKSMVPAGSVPDWSLGRPQRAIGDAIVVDCLYSPPASVGLQSSRRSSDAAIVAIAARDVDPIGALIRGLE